MPVREGGSTPSTALSLSRILIKILILHFLFSIHHCRFNHSSRFALPLLALFSTSCGAHTLLKCAVVRSWR
ncbi:hypothetical protein RJT34_08772 [Clitoria ternatea]|uniref:Uncharacterized protein n=1 Tax=Clitoria ternatea TaxID=43366 RepID=A0AAN9PSZ4_CLITE